MLALAFVLMQFMISAKAGLVNYVDGQTSVRLHEQVPAGTLIQTGSASHVELLLNPGSFLRLDENSIAVLDSVELTNIAVRVVAGGALLEVADIDKRTPIRITTGSLTVLVASSGMYRFSGDTASVLDGKLQTADSSITVKKGRQITANGDQYEQTKAPANAALDALELWSRQRSAQLATANALAYNSNSAGGTFYPNGFSNGVAWMYSPFLNCFTFIPRHPYRSYYGYSFVPLFVLGSGGFTRPPTPDVRSKSARRHIASSTLPSCRGWWKGGTTASVAGHERSQPRQCDQPWIIRRIACAWWSRRWTRRSPLIESTVLRGQRLGSTGSEMNPLVSALGASRSGCPGCT